MTGEEARMSNRGVVTATGDGGRRLLVQTPWGHVVATLHDGTLATGSTIEGVQHDIGAATWRDAASGTALTVEVLLPPSERAVAEKLFIGN
jgi:hypothetical protein